MVAGSQQDWIEEKEMADKAIDGKKRSDFLKQLFKTAEPAAYEEYKKRKEIDSEAL